MDEITLTMPYYHNGKKFHEITIQSTVGFVDVFDGEKNIIFTGYTVNAIKFIYELEK